MRFIQSKILKYGSIFSIFHIIVIIRVKMCKAMFTFMNVELFSHFRTVLIFYVNFNYAKYFSVLVR